MTAFPGNDFRKTCALDSTAAPPTQGAVTPALTLPEEAGGHSPTLKSVPLASRRLGLGGCGQCQRPQGGAAP